MFSQITGQWDNVCPKPYGKHILWSKYDIRKIFTMPLGGCLDFCIDICRAACRFPFTLSWIAIRLRLWGKKQVAHECDNHDNNGKPKCSTKMPSELFVVYLGSLVVTMDTLGLWGVATSLHTVNASVSTVYGFGGKIALVREVLWLLHVKMGSMFCRNWMEGTITMIRVQSDIRTAPYLI